MITRFPPSLRAPIDVRGAGNDPRSFAYLDEPVLIEAPLRLGCGLHNYPLEQHGPHPFVRATYAMLQGSTRPAEQRQALRSLLDTYYRHVQPSSFAEWVGISADGSDLHEIPPWAGPFPWETRSVADTRRDRQAVAVRESARGGVELSIAAGWQFVGPMVPEKVTLEVERLRELALSMASSGFQRSDARTGDIIGTVLWWPDRPHDPWRWIVHDGHHRAAVASAVGLETIPLRVVRLVRRDDAPAWPNVLSGLYSLDAALETFDGRFSPLLPRVTKRWTGFLSESRPPGYDPCPARRCRAGS